MTYSRILWHYICKDLLSSKLNCISPFILINIVIGKRAKQARHLQGLNNRDSYSVY